MKPYIYSLLLALALFPVPTRAQNPLPFSYQGDLRVEFRVDNAPLRENASEPLKSVFVRSYTEVPISYQVSEFLGGSQEEASDETALRYRELVATQHMYLQIWRGVPHENPHLLFQKDISGTYAGIQMYRFPESDENYFLTVVATALPIEGVCASVACDIDEVSKYFVGSVSDASVKPIAHDGFAFHILKEHTLYSNLLFLPGIKGSRLYAGEPCGTDSCKEKLWEPFGNDDITKLFLAEDGSSVRDDIFAIRGDVVDRVLLTGIYASFIQQLNEMEDSQLVLDYEALAYDWRLSLPDLITKGAEVSDRLYYASSTPNPALSESLKRLGVLTKSGKVSIIAHSNGGLLAKALLQFLGDAEAERLIDKVVFIGVPQGGAPQSLGALLYGYREGIPWQLPLVVSPGVARAFGENSPMAYHLLPSEAFFQTSEASVVIFSAEHSYSYERAAFGAAVDSFTELRDFLLAHDGGRTKPAPSDTAHANVLNANLLTYAEDMHKNIDAWTPPPGIQVYQVAGWGVQTVTGIEYYEDCLFVLCKPKYRPTFSESGDGVVPTASAHLLNGADNVHTYWIDLREHQSLLEKKDHGTLLDIPEVRDLVEKIVASTTSELPKTISKTEPSASQTNLLRLFLHSPLSLSVTDSSGNYTGSAADGSWTETIPGSEYGIFGEVQFLSLPVGDAYTVELEGYASGTFTLEVQEILGDEVIKELKFIDLPSDENTTASLRIEKDIEGVGLLEIDMDGDGEVDSEVAPHEKKEVTIAIEEKKNTLWQPSARTTSRLQEITIATTTASVSKIPTASFAAEPPIDVNVETSTSLQVNLPPSMKSATPDLVSRLLQFMYAIFRWVWNLSSSLLFGMTA